MLVNNVEMLEAEEPITVTESDAVDIVELALKHHTSDITTQSMSMIALLKLSSRFSPTSERIRDIILQQKGSLVLELQQRSIEFNSILQKHQNIKSSLLERMPVLDESVYIEKRAGSSQAALFTDKPSQPTSSITHDKLPNGVAKPPTVSLIDLVDLSSDDAPVPSSSTSDFLQDLLGVDLTNPPSSGAPPATADILMDLLSMGTPSSPITMALPSSTADIKISGQGYASEMKSSPSPAAPVQVMDLLDSLSSSTSIREEDPVYPSVTAFQSSSLKITFNFTKQTGKPQVTTINATFTNLTSNTYTDFIFQAAVPKFVQLHLSPASNNILPASGTGSITQTLSVTNTLHGQKALAMRLRVAYKVNDQDKLEQGQVNNFPPGL